MEVVSILCIYFTCLPHGVARKVGTANGSFNTRASVGLVGPAAGPEGGACWLVGSSAICHLPLNPLHLSDNAPAYLHLHAHECILQLLRRIYVYICIYVSVFYFLPLAVVVACGAVVNVAHVVYVTFLIPTLQRRTFSTINAHLSYTCINCRPAELSGQSDPSPLAEFQSKQRPDCYAARKPT